MTAPDEVAIRDDEPTIFGHPRALYVLFFAELWERFCYYGMRALLAVHIAKEFFGGDPQAQAHASSIYGGFTALIYAMGIFGGAIADRVLGYRRSIMLGGTLMAAGEFVLMAGSKNVFFYGLALMIVGNGMFKPNISTLVGKLYKQNDPRRDGGFTIFYMGINIGALLAPVVCQAISEAMGSYRYGFMAAGFGMLLGLAVFGLNGKLLGDKGLAPENRKGISSIFQVLAGAIVVSGLIYVLLSLSETVLGYTMYATLTAMLLFLLVIASKEEKLVRQRMIVLVGLLLLNVVFWLCFEQAGNSLNFFAKNQLNALHIGGWTMPFEWWQSVNSTFIVLLGPVFAALWVALDKRGLNPSIPAKFGFGLLGVGLGFLILNTGIGHADANGKVMWYFLALLYLVHTMGELCLSPVGLSMVTKLAPSRMTGMVMGGWFLALGTGNWLAGVFSTDAAKGTGQAKTPMEQVQAYADTFQHLVYIGLGIGIVVILVSPIVNRWMHGVK
jgi:POT family proton-dependent oligopeptide transporter